MFQWRRFQFFDKEQLMEEDGKDAMKLFFSFQPTCSTSGRGHIIFGDAKGAIRIINRDFQCQEFQAYETDVIDLRQLKRTNLLLSIGNDDLETASIKIWKLDQTTAEGAPMLAKTIKIFSSKFTPCTITCFAVLEDLSQLAVGLANGSVMLFEGNLLRDRYCKQSLIQKEGGACVTFVAFREDAKQLPSLFVVTEKDATTYFTKSKSGASSRVVLDEEGGGQLMCSALTEDKGWHRGIRLVVGRDEAVYFYDVEDKGVCFAFEGKKKIISWFGSYLVLVNEEEVSGSGVGGRGGTSNIKHALTIFDLKNKLIAFQATFDPIVNLVSEWGSIHVFTATQQLHQLSERDLSTKMEMLFRKNLYSTAISLASSQDCDKSYIIDIFQRYGDHLYRRGEFDNAITQYVETIKFVEPSYVIRKFLDAQRIHNLTRYLQALHEKGCANTDHTTLLLNCYTKLKDTEKLNEFVRSRGVVSGAGGKASSRLDHKDGHEQKAGVFKFDVETAINVCKQAGYLEHALYLAQKHGQSSLYLKLLMDHVGDLDRMKEALLYIRSLPFHDAYRFALEYGSRITEVLPTEAAALFTSLCMGYAPTLFKVKSIFDDTARDAGGNNAGDVDSWAETAGSGSGSGSGNSSGEEKGKDADSKGGVVAHLPRARPEDFINAFVSHQEHLQTFLEDIVYKGGGKCSAVVWNTLLELYLRASADVVKNDAEAAANAAAGGMGVSSRDVQASSSSHNLYYDKIMNILKVHVGKYDINQALVLTQTYVFEDGMLFLYKELKKYHEIVHFYMERGAYSKVIKYCGYFAEYDPQLWVDALCYFASKPEPLDDELKLVLKHVKQLNLLPPLLVVQILSRNPHKTLSVLKDFLVSSLQMQSATAQQNQLEIRRYQEDTQAMKEEIEELKTQATTFTEVNCFRCSNALTLPAVHFLCMHSFHQRCVSDNDKECPKCAPKYKQLKERKEALKKNTSDHDSFDKAIKNSTDGFRTVAEYFARGAFDGGIDDKDKSNQR